MACSLYNSFVNVICNPDRVIAQMEEKSPELKKLIFPARKQQLEEARFMVWKIVFLASR